MAAPVAARRLAPVAAAALAALLPVAPLHAADTRWSGSADGQWTNSANWDAGIPTAALRAILPTGVSTAALILPAGAQALDLIVEAAGYSITGSSGSSLALTSPTGNLVVDGGVGTAAGLIVNTVAAITTPNATIGISSGNSGNTVTLTDTGVSLNVANTLNVGYDGTQNRLEVKAGAALSAANLWIGGLGTATGNQALIDGTGSTATVSGSTVLGYDGSANLLGVIDGASLSTPVLSLGLQSGSLSNGLQLGTQVGTGGTAQITVSNELSIGAAGAGNALVVYADGQLTKSGAGDLVIGRDASSTSNMVIVSGGTANQTSGSFMLGLNGAQNTLTVESGGQLTTTQARIGRNSGADSNTATVTGSGSLWTLNGSLRVGESGSGNSLTIDSGGAVTIATSSNLFIGFGAGSNNNTLKVTGGGSTLTATTGTSQVIVSGNTGTNNKLILSNGGSANVLSITTGPGGILQIGEGGAPGTLVSTASVTGNDGGLSLGGGAVVFDHNASSYSFDNVLSGALRVEQKGSGTTTLTAASSYTGKTEVLAGTLALSGASNGIAASPAIEVSSGANLDVTGVTGGFSLGGSQTLAGGGSVAGDVTAPSGSTISPGLNGGTGTLTFINDVTLAGNLAIDVNGSQIDQLVAAVLLLSPGASLAFTTTAAPSGAALALATYSSLLGTFSSVTGLPAGYSLDYAWQGNQIALVANAAPDAVPGPLPLAGALVAWRSGRALRRRLRGR